ncbi:hypothetical protein GGP53_003178 [Salinibacter ruber]|uniref:hypothetical protein n=1 Tax=Salinibacter ruber TaxID=146919 RepID=UPI002166C3F9|nr:hypothetical protein [Salinibacter ruber]MCS3629298.1 hypothetical protein [Salinibacter ruber]MCS4146206.1 hypothetical protein [Salinibacter ruber]
MSTSYSRTLSQPEWYTPFLWRKGMLAAVCVGVVAVSGQPLLMGASLLVLACGIALLWQPGLPPVLLFAFFYQWAQVSGELFYSLFTGVSLTSRFVRAPYIREAIGLGLLGLLVLAIGMWIPLRSLRVKELVTTARAEIQRINIERIFWVYIALLGYILLLPFLRSAVPAASQILLAAAELRWALVFLLTYSVLLKQRGWFFLAVAVLFEFIYGLGFFSGFKTVFFVLAVAAGMAYTRLEMRSLVAGSAIAIAVFLTGSVWSVIESDYRQFLNRGTGQQVVYASKWEQVQKFADLASSVSWAEVQRGAELTIKRVAYVQFFAATLSYVPEHQAHEGGALWGRAIKHVLMPRILFPEKPVLKSDSRATREYTGLDIAGGARGTSISIGYMGESYVDFGRYGMFLPVFLLGLVWGGMLLYFVRRANVKVVGLAFAVAVLLNANRFEITSLKLLGGVLMKFIVLALALRFGAPYVSSWLLEEAK